MKSKDFFVPARDRRWLHQRALWTSSLLIPTFSLVSSAHALPLENTIPEISKNASARSGIPLADGTRLLIPNGWGDTSGFGISFWFPDMKPPHSSGRSPSSRKVHLLSIELGKKDPRPIGRVTPEDEYANMIAFTGNPTITPIPGSNLLALAFPESQKRHPTYHFTDLGSVDYVARADAQYSAMLECSKADDCSGDVRIKSINIQYRIVFDGAIDASKIIDATNKLIFSWIDKSK